jgi:hypothetical protein
MWYQRADTFWMQKYSQASICISHGHASVCVGWLQADAFRAWAIFGSENSENGLHNQIAGIIAIILAQIEVLNKFIIFYTWYSKMESKRSTTWHEQQI